MWINFQRNKKKRNKWSLEERKVSLFAECLQKFGLTTKNESEGRKRALHMELLSLTSKKDALGFKKLSAEQSDEKSEALADSF